MARKGRARGGGPSEDAGFQSTGPACRWRRCVRSHPCASIGAAQGSSGPAGRRGHLPVVIFTVAPWELASTDSVRARRTQRSIRSGKLADEEAAPVAGSTAKSDSVVGNRVAEAVEGDGRGVHREPGDDDGRTPLGAADWRGRGADRQVPV